VATAVNALRRNPAALATAAAAVALIAALAATGRPLGGRILQRFEPHGIVALSPPDIRRAEVRIGEDRIGMHRMPDGSWVFDGAARDGVPTEVASHLETALRFLHVSAPTRTLESGNDDDAGLTDFGLDPPPMRPSISARSTRPRRRNTPASSGRGSFTCCRAMSARSGG
jgi:hypothetical protein